MDVREISFLAPLPVYRYCILIALIIYFLLLSCRKNESDSNAQQHQTPTELDTSKIHEALRQFDALPPQTKGKAKILEAIRDEAEAMGYNDQACYLSMDLARGQSDRGNLDSARYYYEYAEPFCNKPIFDVSITASYLYEYGAFYHALRSDFVAANKSYYNALQYLKEHDLADTELAIPMYIMLHVTQVNLGNNDQALEYLKEGEKLALQLDSRQGIAASAAHLGTFYSHQGNDSLAILYYDKSLTYEEIIWDPNILTSALMGKASVLTKTGKAELAIPLLQKAIDVSRRESVIYSQVDATIRLAQAYNKLGRYRETIQTITPELTAKTKEVNTEVEQGHRVLMEAYEGLGDYKKALAHQRNLYAWKDSILNVEKKTSLHELELKYQTANKDKEIAANELLIVQQQNKLSRKNNLILFITTAAMLVIIIVISLYKNAVTKRKLKELEIQTLRRKQEIDLLRSTMQGEEQERQRLARELHDGIGSMISSAIMRLSLMKNEDQKLEKSESYHEVLQLLQQTGSEVRKTAHNMMPDTIYKQSIFEAVRSFNDSVSRGTSLKIDTQFYGVQGELAPNCKLVVYRIIQELVHNIIKHADARHAIVQGVMNENQFIITVEDDGKGFDLNAPKRGIGLNNVEARVKSLDGEMHIESSPGQGTTVNIEFDCSQVLQNHKI